MEENLSEDEFLERVAILKRFRTLLEQQRTKFKEYLRVLEAQEQRINEENVEALLGQTKLEEQIISSLGSLQKAIVPMQALYTKSHAAQYNPAQAVPIEKIQWELTVLQEKVQAQNLRNRQLLKNHMVSIQQSLDSMTNPYRTRQSVYAQEAGTGSMIQIDA